MADEWGLPGVNDGWLPDESAIPPVVRSVKVFVEDRLPQAGRQSRSEDQRNIQGIFSKLSFTEDSQPKEESDSTRSLPASPALNRSQTLLDDQPSLPGIVDGVVGMISDDAMLQQSQDSFYRCG